MVEGDTTQKVILTKPQECNDIKGGFKVLKGLWVHQLNIGQGWASTMFNWEPSRRISKLRAKLCPPLFRGSTMTGFLRRPFGFPFQQPPEACSPSNVPHRFARLIAASLVRLVQKRSARSARSGRRCSSRRPGTPTSRRLLRTSSTSPSRTDVPPCYLPAIRFLSPLAF